MWNMQTRIPVWPAAGLNQGTKDTVAPKIYVTDRCLFSALENTELVYSHWDKGI